MVRGIGLVFLASSWLLGCSSSGPPPAEPPSGAPKDTSVKHDASEASGGTQTPASSAEPAAPGSPGDLPGPSGPATLEGAILGKPFHAVGACVIGAPKKGFVLVEIYDAKDFDVKTSCGVLPPVLGARKIGLLLPWKAGETVDIGTLKPGKQPEGYVMEAISGKRFTRKDMGRELRPKGSIEVVRAGAHKGDVGRIRLDTTLGKDQLAGEVDVEVAPDVAAAWGE